MAWVIGLGYWVGAALLWLPLAVALRPHDTKRGAEDLLSGIALAVIWPVSVPILALVAGIRVLAHRLAPAHVSALARG